MISHSLGKQLTFCDVTTGSQQNDRLDQYEISAVAPQTLF